MKKDMAKGNANMKAEGQEKVQEFLDVYEKVIYVAMPIQWVVTGATSLLTLMAGIKLKSLTSPGLVKGGAILSMIPCLSGCCILGLVFGIITLTTLGKPEVKAGFAAMKRRTGM